MTVIAKLLLALGAMLAVQAYHAGGLLPDVLRFSDRAAERMLRDQRASYRTMLAAYDQAQTQRPDDVPLARCAFIQHFVWAEDLAWADARAFAFLFLQASVAGWLFKKPEAWRCSCCCTASTTRISSRSSCRVMRVKSARALPLTREVRPRAGSTPDRERPACNGCQAPITQPWGASP